jgi:hypothetical protein
MRDYRCVLGELFLVWIVDISPDTLGINCTNGINIQKAAEKWKNGCAEWRIRIGDKDPCGDYRGWKLKHATL